MVTFSRNGTSFWLCKQILSKTVVPPELWRYLGENHHNTPRPEFCFLSLGFPCTFMAAEWWPMCSKSIMQFELNWIVCIGFFWHYLMHQAFVHLKFPKFALKNTNTTYIPRSELYFLAVRFPGSLNGHRMVTYVDVCKPIM